MPETPPPRLDEIDALLLDLLQHDAGRTLHDLGDQVGLSPSAAQRRIARYREDGLISGQVAVLDPHRLGPTVLATVLVTLDCGRIDDRLFKADDNIRRYETLVVFDTVKTGLAVPIPAPRP
ncbi:Lrp/AsnC family transcriptional regulator [Actinomadura nitritigenes]|uniref:Lrp/AsnC family transcriptional regulator n=1 Tax=Actinomadura nitritigenes TaxID=134602 RepID=UPI003D8E9B34